MALADVRKGWEHHTMASKTSPSGVLKHPRACKGPDEHRKDQQRAVRGEGNDRAEARL